FGDDISLYLLLCLAISECQAIVLAHMFRPGCEDKRFDIPLYVLNITVDTPSSRSIATQNPCISANGSEKFFRFVRCDLVIDCNEHRAKLLVGGKSAVLQRGHSQVIPGSEINRSFGKTQKQAKTRHRDSSEAGTQ